MPVLPLDIVDIIIDLLAQDDPKFKSIKACSLVCHDFLPICRKHIFAAIALNDSSEPPPIRTPTTPLLQELLSVTPEIANHIRDLVYCCSTSADLKDPALIQTFQKFTRLRSLCILPDTRLPYGQHLWNDNSFRPALLHLLHRPSLTEFLIFGIADFVLTDLEPCVNLDNFTAAFLTTDITSPSKSPNSSIGFRKLSVGGLSASMVTQMCETKCTDGKPFINFDKLSDISIAIHDSDDIHILRKLFSLCKQLVEVHIMSPVRSLTGLSKLLKPSSQMLKRVDISITGLSDEAGSNDPLCGFANELEHMCENNVIEDLAIEISIKIDSGCTRGDEWGRLDKVLCHSGWAKLRRVSLLIVIGSHAREDNLKEELQKLPETQFQWLSSTKSLSFKFEVVEKVL